MRIVHHTTTYILGTIANYQTQKVPTSEGEGVIGEFAMHFFYALIVYVDYS